MLLLKCFRGDIMSNINLEEINFCDASNKYLVPVGISNKHVHVSADHCEILFGKGAGLTPTKDLSQPGQFACNEVVNVVGPKGCLEKVRILGPFRSQTQVELAQTDARTLGLNVPLRNSGDLAGSPGCVLVGPKGYVILKEGVIIANTHIHLSAEQGKELGIRDKELVDIYFKAEKRGALLGVLARVNEEYEMDLHIDTDEANAFRVKNGDKALLVKRD